MTGAGTVMNGLRPRPGSSIAILGTGAVGLAALLGAVASGCTTIIAVDRVESRLELARRLGATHTINTSLTANLEIAIRAAAPRGVQYMVDSAGVEQLIAAAVPGLAIRGTLGLVATPPGVERTLGLPWGNLLLRGQVVRGFIEGHSVPEIFIPRMIDLYAQGRFPFDRLVRFYRFEEINQAVDDQKRGVTIKAILDVPSQVRASIEPVAH
jgi:aryl-alcohol dehydrogenase